MLFKQKPKTHNLYKITTKDNKQREEEKTLLFMFKHTLLTVSLPGLGALPAPFRL